MKRNYSDKTMQLLSTFPQVKHINNKRISFTHEYRVKLYDALEQRKNLKRFMKEDGFPKEHLHDGTFKSIISNFKKMVDLKVPKTKKDIFIQINDLTLKKK